MRIAEKEHKKIKKMLEKNVSKPKQTSSKPKEELPVSRPVEKKNDIFISSENIENRVNDIIRGDMFEDSTFNNVDKKMDDIDSKLDATLNESRNTIIPSRSTIMNKPVEEPVAPKKEQPSVTSSAPSKPTISLDDVDENEFFDDFFED